MYSLMIILKTKEWYWYVTFVIFLVSLFWIALFTIHEW